MIVAPPVAIAVVMLGIGLALSAEDFRRVMVYPKAVVIALGCQLILLPVVCFGLIILFEASPGAAVGMVLLAASPGGPSAAVFSHVFKGNVALNITLTAMNSVVSVVTLPLWVGLALRVFYARQGVDLHPAETLQVLVIVLLPVAIGMLTRWRRPHLADRAARPVKALSIVVMVSLIPIALVLNLDTLKSALAAVSLITLLFSVIGLTAGYWIPRLAKVERPQAIACAMEIGIHNTPLALGIALSPELLGVPEMAMPVGVYAICSMFTSTAFGLLLVRRRPSAPGPAGEPQRRTA
ncbi:bile acid:sodium symporter family protein [Bailinhaonella thermotolerans]|uniref:Bile acid:sodium symporter family protein n=2 Tax=Bailinhaonella thermotolerans TaxID=1070861 RepID=A0A3A4A624_9ACTN|nr:bile acid:sodium symporter family protein [Bailinhaonella thermotolerans]